MQHPCIDIIKKNKRSGDSTIGGRDITRVDMNEGAFQPAGGCRRLKLNRVVRAARPLGHLPFPGVARARAVALSPSRHPLCIAREAPACVPVPLSPRGVAGRFPLARATHALLKRRRPLVADGMVRRSLPALPALEPHRVVVHAGGVGAAVAVDGAGGGGVCVGAAREGLGRVGRLRTNQVVVG
eukprot:scaffold4124_cov109-Isochrysis_galbana.AAC.6